ncbi:MAG: arginase family protein [Acidobacteria bacterium]|nr:arginase family protein [Acidobacteriota bacterium]
MQIDVIDVRYESPLSAIPNAKGPSALMERGLLERVGTSGAVRHVEIAARPRTGSIADHFELLTEVASAVRQSREEGHFPIVLSGSCLVGLGTLCGIAAGSRGVAWFDCHGDFNTPDTTMSGLLDGMTTAIMTGRCWKGLSQTVPGFEPLRDEALLLVATRDLDPDEALMLSRSSVVLAPADAVNRDGGQSQLESLHSRASSIYIHVDLDVLDPSVGMANRFAKPGGLTSEALTRLMVDSVRRGGVEALGFASYDPDADTSGRVAEAAIDSIVAVARQLRSR